MIAIRLLLIAILLPLCAFGMEFNPADTPEAAFENTSKLLEWAKQKKIDMKKFLAKTDEENFTLLHGAAELLYLDEARLLLDNGADVNAKGGLNKNITPLHQAIKACGKQPVKVRDMIALLCSYGPKIDFDMKYRLMQIRMYRPEHGKILTECLALLHEQEPKKEKIV